MAEARPDDVETALYLASVLERSGRKDEAVERYRVILKVAPSHRQAREAFIDVLAACGRFSEAMAECRKLVERNPDDIDALRLLGELRLRSAEDDREQAEREAIAIWRRIADIRPDDPVLALKVAEICRNEHRRAAGLRPGSRQGSTPPLAAGETETSPLLTTAEELYREAIRGSQGDRRYHEYLGEFLHRVGRREEAVEAWAKIAAPPGDTATNRHRLAEVYSLFGYHEEAVDAGRKALVRRPDDFRLRGFQIDLLLAAKQYEAAQEQLAHLDRLADTPEDRQRAIHRRIEVYTAADRIEREIARLRQSLQGSDGSVHEHWTLGLLLAERRQYAKAADHLQAALAAAPDDPRLLRDSARVLERKGDMAAAVELYRRLAEIEPRRRSAHYETIVRLELRSKRPERAKEAADALLQAASSSSRARSLRAEVAFRLDDIDGGLEQLRRAVQTAPRDLELRTRYTHALAEHGRTAEAREHYWRCFELSERLEEQLSLTRILAELAHDAASQQVLIEQLRRVGDRQGPKVPALCLAEAHRQLGDLAAARRELTEFLVRSPEDLDALMQLAKVCDAMQDWPAAIEHQERIVALDGDWRHVVTWARYYTELNRSDWLSLARRNKEELFKEWAETFRRYRELTALPPAERKKRRKQIEALRDELQQLSWARDKFHRKEEALRGKHRGRSRTFSVWRELQAECDVLQFVAEQHPITVADVEKRLARTFEETGTRAARVLAGLNERGYLNRRRVGTAEQHVPAGTKARLLERLVHDFGQRMIGGSIEMTGEELAKLNRIVRQVNRSDGDEK